MISLILVLVSLLLIFTEFFLPGGIVGTAGVLMMLGAFVLYGGQAPTPFHLIGFIFLSLVLTYFTVMFALKKVKAKHNSISSDADQTGFYASTIDESLIGSKGTAFSDLKPSGHIEIEGTRYQAVSKIAYIKKGTPIEIIGGKGAYYIVKKTGMDS